MINLNISKKMFSPKFYPTLFDYSKRIEVFQGSAGSGKSHFITQKLIIKALKEKRRVLVARRYGTTIRNSVFALFESVLKDFKIYSLCKIRQTDFHILLPNGSEIIFLGLDQEEKLLSLANISDVFVEEVYEISFDIFQQLDLRLRGTSTNLQIYIAYNPISQSHWLYKYVNNLPSNAVYYHSTYKDNPFLPAAYVATIDEMETRNPPKYRIYGLGEWGLDPEGLVYRNWKIEKPDIDFSRFEIRVGMDIGFTDKTAIVVSYYDKANHRIYIPDSFAKPKLSLDEIVIQLEIMGLRGRVIYCDSADPRAIQFFRTKGFNVMAAKKGKGSVETGIAFLQNHQIIVLPHCKEIISEFENYSYIKDRDGNYTNKTTHEFSHSLDGLRYAYSSIYANNGLDTVNKKVLGL